MNVNSLETENLLSRPLPPGGIEFTNPPPERPTKTVRQFCERNPDLIAQLDRSDRKKYLELIAGILYG